MKRRAHRGFSLVTAIFLIVVIALVAAFLVTIGSVQHTSSAFSLVGARAHFAAVSGLEWAAHRVLDSGACVAPPPFTVTGGASGNFELSVTCGQTAVDEGGVTYDVFDIDAMAEFGTSGQENYFSRPISASVTSAP